ncbi:MAG: anion transporter [Melioribacteraceae bacterium]|nr:anion transporter [Melioribacteraceae bacterium]
MLTLHSLIILITLAGVAIGRLPKLRMNRATIALVGAGLLIITNALELNQAYTSVDWDTILLLFAMMILNINLSLAGFFQLIAAKIIRFASSPKQLLLVIVFSSGILSALFLNDTICLMFTPLVLEIAITLKRNPIPYLMGLAVSANIGSAATIVGNPQNMIIGISSGISFTDFAIALLPVSLISLFVGWIIIVLVYKKEFAGNRFEIPIISEVKIYKPLFIKSIIATLLMIAAFIYGFSIPLSAFAAACLLLVTRRLKPERVFREIDWSLLVFFAALFIVTGAIETTGISNYLFLKVESFICDNVVNLSVISAVLSNLVSNVPAVLLFRPIITTCPDPTNSWLILAMATTFAGNLTLIGSVANLIVAESAKKRGIHLSFVEYLKSGFLIAVISIGIGIIFFL